MIIVDHLDARRSLDVTGGHVALALGGQVKGLRAVDLDAQHHTLEVEDDVDDVLDDSGDRGELVLHANVRGRFEPPVPTPDLPIAPATTQ